MVDLERLLEEIVGPWFDAELGALADRLGISGETKTWWSKDNPNHWGKVWIGRGSETGNAVNVGFDFYRYDESTRGHPPLVCDLDANLALDRGQREKTACERVSNALIRTFSDKRVTPVEVYPNKEPIRAKNNGILLLRGNALPRRMIDICVRGGSAPEDSEDQLRAALESLRTQLDTFISAVDISWGALHGEEPHLTKDVITGWCGEVAVFYREQRNCRRVKFSRSWYAPFDLEGEDNLRIEVKASRQPRSSTFTLSPNEVAIALTVKPYRLVLVRIPGEIVEKLYDALKKSESNGGRVGQEIPEISRLRQILGSSGQGVTKNRDVIRDAIEELKKLDDTHFIFDKTDPFQWIDEPEMARKIINRRMSMSFPFSREWNDELASLPEN